MKAKVEKKFPGMEGDKKREHKGKKTETGRKEEHKRGDGMKKIGTHAKRSGEHHKAIGEHKGYTLGQK